MNTRTCKLGWISKRISEIASKEPTPLCGIIAIDRVLWVRFSPETDSPMSRRMSSFHQVCNHGDFIPTPENAARLILTLADLGVDLDADFSVTTSLPQ